MPTASQDDIFVPARLHAARISVGVALTTEATRAVATRHRLSAVATIAVGRLMTAASLLHLLPRRAGSMSLQVLGAGPLRQLFADVDASGRLRAYSQGDAPALPLGATGRRSTAASVGRGMLSVLWDRGVGEHSHSTTELAGEIDADAQHFAVVSEQVPSILVGDVILDATGAVQRAGGLLVQAMPDAPVGALGSFYASVTPDGFNRALAAHGDSAETLLRALVPDAQIVEGAQNLAWHCRCSHERVVGALRMLGVDELKDMLEKGATTEVNCEFCKKSYHVGPREVEAALA